MVINKNTYFLYDYKTNIPKPDKNGSVSWINLPGRKQIEHSFDKPFVLNLTGLFHKRNGLLQKGSAGRGIAFLFHLLFHQMKIEIGPRLKSFEIVPHRFLKTIHRLFFVPFF